MSGEVWRQVPSKPQFLASSEGRIMVAPYYGEMPHGGKRSYGGQPHFGVWNKQDGRFITVYKGHTYKIARLVCEAFNGKPPAGSPACMHLDENAANNRAENLAWGTQKENLNAPEYLAALRLRRGDNSSACKFSNADVRRMRAMNREGIERRTIEAVYGISNAQLCNILNNKERVDAGGVT